MLQGYSRALNLNLRWEEGRLVWHDPATGQPILTLEDERRGRIQAEARAANEQERASKPRPGLTVNGSRVSRSRSEPKLPRPATGSWKRNCTAYGTARASD